MLATEISLQCVLDLLLFQKVKFEQSKILFVQINSHANPKYCWSECVLPFSTIYCIYLPVVVWCHTAALCVLSLWCSFSTFPQTMPMDCIQYVCL